MTVRAKSRITAARSRASGESARAERAAQIARRHESLQRDGLPALAEFHEGMARMHRRMEHVHRVAAKMHQSFADRLESWNETVSSVRPTFIGSVAESVGAGSAAVALFGADATHTLVATSDATALAAQDIEFTVGEGPMREATVSARAVAATGGELPERWPQYGTAVAGLGVASVVAVPLAQQGTCLGALAVFDPRRTGAVDLSSLQAAAAALTRTVLLDVQRGNPVDGPVRSPLWEEADDRSVVYRAAGVVSAQHGHDPGTALALIRARAFADDQRSATVAHRILRGELRLV